MSKTTKIETKLKRKYAKELKKVSNSKDFREAWLSFLQDLTNDAESEWDMVGVRYDTVMTKKDWEKFSGHPQRRPYKSKAISIRDPEKKLRYIVSVLKDSYGFFESLGGSKYKEELKSGMAVLLDCALNARYEMESIRMADVYMGRSEKDRDAGKVDPTLVSLSSLEYAIREYAQFSGKNYKALRKKIFDICDGRLSILGDFYSTCRMDLEFRKDIREIFNVISRDHTLSFRSLKLGWEVWKIFREIGLDVNGFLAFNGFPKYSVVERRLLSFQHNKKHIEEIFKHFKDELPQGYKKYKKDGYIWRYEITQEEADRKKYPKKLRTRPEIKKMIAESEREVFKYFPLAKGGTPRQVILNPIHPAATGRAFQSSTKNSREDRVNVIVMTPRGYLKDDYLPILAHEVTHAMHRIILEKGENAGVLKKGSAEMVPSGVMEDFSKLVEHEFYSDKDLPYKKKFKGKEFPTLRSGLASRFQVPYSLVQLGIRRRFDELWDEGYRGVLPDQFIWDLKFEFDKKLRDWFSPGFEIKFNYLNSFGLFDPYNPDDGLVYMKRYVVKQKEPKVKKAAKPKKSLGMTEAFRKKYGKEWVKSKDARTVLLWLLLESGRNYATETYDDFILNKSPQECLAELESIGVKESEI